MSVLQDIHDRAPLALAALWWGSLATLGFVVVPLLFAHLPAPAVAGSMAAKLFTAQTWVSLICGLLLLILSRRQGAASRRLTPGVMLFVMGGMLLALLAEFAVAPHIVARDNLRLWHSLGSAMYLLQWLCAGVCFWKLGARSS